MALLGRCLVICLAASGHLRHNQRQEQQGAKQPEEGQESTSSKSMSEESRAAVARLTHHW